MTEPTLPETPVLDELRRTDFGRLDAGGHVYLDYTGAGLYADSQLRDHLELLRENVFGNPHSSNPTSAAMTELVESARASVLDFFSASPDEYVAIFTPNATGALRLVGEAYPFRPDDRFLLTFDNHNSVNGIREFARARGAETTYVPSEPPDLRVDEDLLTRYLTEVGGDHHNLFAYPAQSNFSGVQHPLAWIEYAHAHGWDVLLDAAAYVPTNRLDLSRSHPDFVVLSFYKMFGWPTGVGVLLARREALAKLERPWFSGGARLALPVLVRDYVRPGKLRIVFSGMHFVGPDSETALRTALAAAVQKRFWNVLELLYENQGTENTGWVTDSLLRSIVDAVPGLNTQKMLDARHSAEVDRLLAEADALAQRAGVSSTPTFAVGKTGSTLRIVHVSSLGATGLEPAIDAALKS